MSPEATGSRQINIRIDEEDYEALAAAAFLEGEHVGPYCRQFLHEYSERVIVPRLREKIEDSGLIEADPELYTRVYQHIDANV